MQAGAITGTRTFELREVPEPRPAPGGVVVDVALCGVCGTDIAAYAHGSAYNPSICGHEWTGVVSARGDGVRSVSEGDRVVVSVPTPCGACPACRSGHAVACAYVQQVAIGVDELAPAHGGFAPRLAVAEGRVLPVPADLDEVQAAQVEPTAVALHAVGRSGVGLGDRAVVLGAGSIGLLVLQLVRSAGAREVIVIEPNPDRRARATALGADLVVDPSEGSEVVAERTGGLGADVVLECSGRAPAIQEAVELARRDGTMCLIGLSHSPATITPLQWLRREITVRVSQAFTRVDSGVAMDMIADGRVRFEGIHTATVSLADLPATMADLADGAPQVKVLVDPR